MNENAVKRPKKLTAWEAGQELTKVADALSSAAAELKDWPALQAACRASRKLIADAFNKHGSHGFDL